MVFYKKSRFTTYLGYWGYQRVIRFALLPKFTEDNGWIWLKPYYSFWTNTGYGKTSWSWKFHGSATSVKGIKKIENKVIRNLG